MPPFPSIFTAFFTKLVISSGYMSERPFPHLFYILPLAYHAWPRDWAATALNLIFIWLFMGAFSVTCYCAISASFNQLKGLDRSHPPFEHVCHLNFGLAQVYNILKHHFNLSQVHWAHLWCSRPSQHQLDVQRVSWDLFDALHVFILSFKHFIPLHWYLFVPVPVPTVDSQHYIDI